MTAGAAMLMWFGELITDRGVGNGMSLLIFIVVIAGMPGQFYSIYQTRGTFILLLTGGGCRDHRRRGLHGAGAAPDPRAVRQRWWVRG